MSSWAVPLAVGSLCIVGAFLLLVPGRMMAPYVIVALVITGVSGLMSGSIGPLVHTGVTKLNGLVGKSLNPWTGVAVSLIVAVIVIGCTALWVIRRQFDLRTFGTAALVPVSVNLVPGPIGAFLIGLVGIIPAAVSAIVKYAFGLGG
jgi:hypothetical protein